MVIVIGSMISLGYYLPVIAAMWMREAPAADEPRAGGARAPAGGRCRRSPAARPSSTARAARARRRAAPQPEVVFVAVLAGAATLFFGIVPQPLFDLVHHAGSALGGLLLSYSAGMSATRDCPFGMLLDIDGVLYVGDEPIEGAHEALAQLRELGAGMRLVTNTTSRSRREVFEHLRELGFDVAVEEVLTPAAMAVRHCRERGLRSVALLVSDGLREDLAELERARGRARRCDAVILGDLGDGFTPEVLNGAFRLMMDGAELVALQHNRYWRRADGLALDVGAYAAALEYATRRRRSSSASRPRRSSRRRRRHGRWSSAVMVGDDVEADVGGAMAAGLPGVLVRTGKYPPGRAARAGHADGDRRLDRRRARAARALLPGSA